MTYILLPATVYYPAYARCQEILTVYVLTRIFSERGHIILHILMLNQAKATGRPFSFDEAGKENPTKLLLITYLQKWWNLGNPNGLLLPLHTY